MGGAPAARGCPIEHGKGLFLGELPLLGADQLREAAVIPGGAPAARGRLIH